MKKLFLLVTGCFTAMYLYAQATSTAPEYRTSGQRMMTYKSLPDQEAQETVQGRFIRQEWSPGEVRFRRLEQTMQIPLIFDVYSNQLYYLQEGVIMEFVEPVLEFLLLVPGKKDTTTYLFRSAYPDVDHNTGDTFYEVITDGRFQLLRCKAKTIHLYKDKDVPEERRDYSKELLYAFVDGKMVMIKKDRNHILEQLPRYADEIRAFMEKKKNRLKTEQAVRELFEYLNTI